MSASVPALFVAHVPVGGLQGSPTGARSPLVGALLYAGVFSAGAALAPLLLRRRVSFALERLVLAAVSLASVVVAATRGENWVDVMLTAVHLTVVTVWIGAVMQFAGSTLRGRSGDLRSSIAQFTPIAVCSAVLTAATGLVLALREPVSVRTLLTSTFGGLLALKILSLLLAAAFGLGHRRARSAAERTTFVRSESAVLATALALGSALIATAAPAAAVTTVARGLSVVSFQPPVSLFLGDDRGVGRLTLLSSDGVEVVDRASGHVTQLTPGATTVVSLARSAATVTVLTGRGQRTVRLPAVPIAVPASPLLTTPDARAAWALGRTLASRQTAAAPASVCVPDVASLARAQQVLLAGRVPAHAIVDGTRANVVRRLTALAAAKTMPTALYLAPSLLDGRVLTAVANLRLPPITVVGLGDPMSPIADSYRAALTLIGGGVQSTAAGLLGYESVVSPSTEAHAALFAAAPVGFLPGVVDAGHQHADDDPWIPGGTIVATTRTVAVRLDCTAEEVS